MMMSISSRPSAPPSPAWGLSPATARRGCGDAEMALQPAQRGAAAWPRSVDAVSVAGDVGQRHVGGDRDGAQRRPGQHHRDVRWRHAAALGDEFGLAGVGEADRVELRLRDRAGDQARRRRPTRARPTASSSASSEQCAPGDARAARECRTGRRRSARTAGRHRTRCPTSRGSSMMTTGPSHTAARLRGSPTAKNGGKPKSPRCSQHLAMTSGPIPAGSPSETASGAAHRLARHALSDSRSPRRGAGRAGSAARAC